MKALCVPIGDRSTAKRWKDKACQAAQKFVERVAEGQGVHAVEQLSFRRTQRPSLYAKDICRVRINAPDDPEPEMDEFRSLTICTTSISGDVSGAYSQRKEIAAEYAEMWENFRSVQFEDVVSYMNKRQFVQYFKLFDGHTQAESEELWAEALQNKSVLSRKDIKGNDTCPVRLPSVLRQMVGVSHKKQYRTTETVEEGDESNQRQKVAALATAAQTSPCMRWGCPSRPLPLFPQQRWTSQRLRSPGTLQAILETWWVTALTRFLTVRPHSRHAHQAVRREGKPRQRLCQRSVRRVCQTGLEQGRS
jgi:hypothetical protein